MKFKQFTIRSYIRPRKTLKILYEWVLTVLSASSIASISTPKLF